MEAVAALGRWVAENEALLSGLVSLVVLVGLVLSPLGKGLRRLVSSGPGEDAGAQPTPAAPAAAAPDPAEPLLAVLAFDNLSSDGEMQFFCDGVSDEIIQRLSRGAHLKVVGRTSSFQLPRASGPTAPTPCPTTCAPSASACACATSPRTTSARA